MVGACLISLMTLAVAPDAASLVAHLGSGTPAERAEAAGQLEAMGRDALPAIEAALRPADAEVRSRLLSVWGRIQKGLMVRPSMVRFEAGRRPQREVALSIARQAGVSIEVSQQDPDRIVDAREPMPMPFWEAIERLGLGRGYLQNLAPGGNHFPVLQFGGFAPAYPMTISGPIRITIEGLHDHRDRLLIAGPWIGVDELNPRIAIPGTAPGRQARFFIDLGMVLEPRMWFTQEGPARVTEAVDDLGQSLVRSEAGAIEADYSVIHNGGGVNQGRVQLDLAMPEKPGRSIVRLRGTIPVALQIRRPVPELEIPLPAPDGKTYAHEDADFTIRQFREDDRGTHVDVDVRLNLDRFELPAVRPNSLATSRVSCVVDRQVDFVDADGRVLDAVAGGSASPDGHARRSYAIWKNMNKSRPARLRYYRMVRAFTEVAFEFHDIPMP